MDYDTDEILVRRVNDVTVVRFKIENLTGTNEVGRIETELARLLAGGTRRLMLDFKYVRYAGSAALGMLIALRQKIQQAKGQLVLSSPQHIRDLLRISRTTKLFDLADDPKAAMERFEHS